MDDDKVTPIRPPEALLEAGGLVDETRVTLSVSGEDLDPDAVTRLLGAVPSSAHRKGDRTKSGRPFKQGVWLLTVEGTAPTEPNELVQRLFARLPSDRGVWRSLCDTHEVRLLFGLHMGSWNRGFDLRNETVALIAATGARLGFDMYFDGHEDDE